MGFNIAFTTIAEENGLTETEKGLTLSSYYFGFTVSQVPGGYMAKRCGGKATLGLCFLLWFPLSAALASSIRSGYAAPVVVGCRLGIGLAQGMFLPAAQSVLGHWIPARRRGRHFAFAMSGMFAGAAIAMVTVPPIVSRFGAHTAFYVAAVMGAAWLAVWICLGSDAPHSRREGEKFNTKALRPREGVGVTAGEDTDVDGTTRAGSEDGLPRPDAGDGSCWVAAGLGEGGPGDWSFQNPAAGSPSVCRDPALLRSSNHGSGCSAERGGGGGGVCLDCVERAPTEADAAAGRVVDPEPIPPGGGDDTPVGDACGGGGPACGHKSTVVCGLLVAKSAALSWDESKKVAVVCDGRTEGAPPADAASATSTDSDTRAAIAGGDGGDSGRTTGGGDGGGSSDDSGSSHAASLAALEGVCEPSSSGRGGRAAAKTTVVKAFERTAAPFPWRAMAACPAAWAFVAGNVGAGMGINVVMSWLPTYYEEFVLVDLEDIHIAELLSPYLTMMAFSVLGGVSYSWLVNGRGLPRARSSKLVAGAAFSLSVAVFPCMGLPRSCAAATVVSSLALASAALSRGGWSTNHMEIAAPEHAAMLYSVANSISAAASVLGISLTGKLLDTFGGGGEPQAWTAAMGTIGALCGACGVLFVLFARGDEVLFPATAGDADLADVEEGNEKREGGGAGEWGWGWRCCRKEDGMPSEWPRPLGWSDENSRRRWGQKG
ncbi:conserved unknown protein [Ectocarpus siliculosus]|uniref:Major facilitator superfamily (MFS) profile domain-containing protein n=1 Tax=Ectocarpus siliculosus TaxID=2880 RepID=D7FU92_ECTSI|nr:conserved unknown protein [Ectocarpus siliculosus]|eukprot:CBJ31619.1 conserved unknown protein [Ectocarpus siliculosus]